MSYVWVFIGGGLGSLLRFEIARRIPLLVHAFPWATLIANLASCILLGALISLRVKGALPPSWQFLLITGFCGGFSTFSTFSFESYALFEQGETALGIANIAGSTILGLLGVFIGIKMFA